LATFRSLDQTSKDIHHVASRIADIESQVQQIEPGQVAQRPPQSEAHLSAAKASANTDHPSPHPPQQVPALEPPAIVQRLVAEPQDASIPSAEIAEIAALFEAKIEEEEQLYDPAIAFDNLNMYNPHEAEFYDQLLPNAPHPHLLDHIPKDLEQEWTQLFKTRLRAFFNALHNLQNDPKGYTNESASKVNDSFLAFMRLASECLIPPSRGGKNNSSRNLKFIKKNMRNAAQPQQQQERKGPQLRPRPQSELSSTLINQVTRLAKRGYMKKAAKKLQQIKPLVNAPEATALLQQLHPARKGICDGSLLSNNNIIVSPSSVILIIKRMCNGSSPGVTGWRPEHLLPLLEDEEAMQLLCSFIRYLLQPNDMQFIVRYLTTHELIPAPKGDGRIRPVAIPDLFLKLASTVALWSIDPSKVLSPNQMGVGIQGGAETIFHRASRALQDLSKTAICLDISNGFQEVRRDVILQQLRSHDSLHKLVPFFGTSYCRDSHQRLLFTDNEGKTHLVRSYEGVRQGCPLGSFYFSLAIDTAIRKTVDHLKDPDSVFAFLDDIIILTQPEKMLSALEVFTIEARRVGLSINKQKTKIVHLGPPPPAVLALGEDTGLAVVSEAKFMGALLGDASKQQNFYIQYVDERSKALRLLQDPRFPLPVAISVMLFSRQLTLGYVSRLLPPQVTAAANEAFDVYLGTWLEALLQCDPSHQVRLLMDEQAQVPHASGGLGIQKMSRRGPVAFLVSAVNAFPDSVLRTFDRAAEDDAPTVYDRSVVQAFKVIEERVRTEIVDNPAVKQDKFKHLQAAAEPLTSWSGIIKMKRDSKGYMREAQISSLFSKTSKQVVIALAKRPVTDDIKGHVREGIIAAKRILAASAVPLTNFIPAPGRQQPMTLNDDQLRNVLRHRLGVGGRSKCLHCKRKMQDAEDLYAHFSTCDYLRAARTRRHTQVVKTVHKIHRMAGLQSAMEVPLLGSGAIEGEEKDEKENSDRLDLMATDPINNCTVELDVSVFSPLTLTRLKVNAPDGDVIRRKILRYSVPARARGHLFKPFIINTFGKLSNGAREWLNHVAQVWIDNDMTNGPRTLGDARRLVFAHFHCGFQRAMGNFVQNCITTQYRNI